MRRLPVLIALLVAHGLMLAAPSREKTVDVMTQPKFKELTSGLSPEARFEAAAMMHISIGQYEQAVPLLEALVKKTPLNAARWELLAIAYNRLGEARDAFDAANIAVTLRPTYEAFLFERGLAFLQLGRDRQAVSDLSRFAKSYSHAPEAWFYLGLAQARLGDSSAAAANLRKARELNPMLSLMTDYYLGLIAAEQGQTIEARKMLKETLDAFKGVDSPMKKVISRQLQQLEQQAGAASPKRGGKPRSD